MLYGQVVIQNMLSVQHCFDALCNIPADIQTTKEKELRKELVKWIISQRMILVQNWQNIGQTRIPFGIMDYHKNNR